MKIESNSSPTTNPLQPVHSQKVDAKTNTTKTQSDNRLNRQSTQKRILNWFSQAGIQEQDSTFKTSSSNEKIRRKNELLGQKKFRNLESILAKALDFCLDDGREEDLDPDWFFSFVKMAEEIFSPAMQELWGKIFAVETARPGSFSLKTLGILKQLTQKDAQIFRHAVNLASRRKGEATPKLLLGYYQKTSLWSFFSSHKEHQLNLANFGLSYPDILSLVDLGLIHNSEIESGELPTEDPVEWRCAGQAVNIQAKRSGTTLVYYKFTTTGAELFKLVAHKRQDLYLKSLKATLGIAFDIA
ncbi:TIGR03899 family protein [Paraglaciecola arctica]|uniref:TIGR03899 family protein n=1 Tax=Paraglaciecola arctica TaxID=1128911 RepID=UPI001C06D3C1|nr:TIGR03899 family protein [Paraglaciecola arctica]MBU3005143.1 TIGR03899 family protein [Paraglaciecola arctica]